MTKELLILLAFALVGAGIGWAIHRSWWAPLMGAGFAALIAIALFLWLLSLTDIG